MQIRKTFILILSLTTSASLGTIWYIKHKKHASPLKYHTTKPRFEHIIQYVSASGTLKAEEQPKVGSLVAGRVIKIIAEENDLVKKDQILTILDNGIGDSNVKKLKATIENAQAQLTYQEKNYARETQLYKAGQISQDEYDAHTRDLMQARATVDITKAELEVEEKTYNNLFIRAPLDSIIIQKNIELGQMITSALDATVLYRLAKDLRKIEAEVNVDEVDVGLVQAEQDAFFTVDTFPKRLFHSKVKKVYYLSKEVQNVVTFVTILSIENADLSLRPGMTINVKIKVAEKPKALCVHNRCLRIPSFKLEEWATKMKIPLEKLPPIAVSEKLKQRDHLWTLEGGVIKQIEVELGSTDGKFTEIVTGISENTEIIDRFEEDTQDSAFLKQIASTQSGIGR